MQYSTASFALLFCILLPGEALASLQGMFNQIQQHTTWFPKDWDWDSWTWSDFFHKDAKVCADLTDGYVSEAGASCNCEKGFDVHRGGYGYTFTCIMPNNDFCISTYCGDYQITKELYPKGVKVEECAVPPGTPLSAGKASWWDKFWEWFHKPSSHTPGYEKSCFEVKADKAEVIDCEYYLGGMKCQTCGIGRYGPEADCSNVPGSEGFTGF